MRNLSDKFLVLALALAGGLWLAGCAATPVEKPLELAGPIFFPAPPDPPRIQHLLTLSGERDLVPPPSDLQRYIVGEDKNSGRLMHPYGVAVHDGKMYVADADNHGLATFDLVQRKFHIMTGTGNGRMVRPINVRIEADGTKYVTDPGRSRVLVYDRNDKYVSALGSEGQFTPVDVALAADKLYVVDIAHHKVQVLDKHSGKPLFEFGKLGREPGEFYQPTNISIGPDGNVYVVDANNFRVQRFTSDGRFIRNYGKAGDDLGTFARPKGIALDRAGRVYVGDSAFNNVQVFDPSGRLLIFFGDSDGPEALELPAGVTIDYDNLEVFRRYADPKFDLEYVILVASQSVRNKIDVFGFGRMSGVEYPPDLPPLSSAAKLDTEASNTNPVR